ncbi:MAG: site-specific integrase [Haliea sp.]
MATIRKLKSGLYNVQIRRKGVPHQSRSFGSLREAKQWAEITERQIIPTPSRPASWDGSGRTPRHRPEHDYCFRSLANRYCQIVLKGRSSFEITSIRLNRIAEHLPEDVREITKYDVNRYRLMRLKQVAPVTCRDELQLIHRVYRWAYRELLLDAVECPSPCTDVAMPPPSKPRNRIISRKELKLILADLPPLMAAITELAYETAMRRGEIVRLTPRHLHLEERYLAVVDGKTGDRSVPLTRRAVELLRMAAERCPHQNARLYPVTPHAVSRAFRRARKRLLLDSDVRFHQLRHSRISEIARTGLNQAQIMMVSGHRDVRSVQRYTHLDVSDVIAALDGR